MKILVCPDKFKNSLSAKDVCKYVNEGILLADKNHEITQLPLADGGDGTLAVLKQVIPFQTIGLKVNDPLFRPIMAQYGFSKPYKAYIEMATASGLGLLSPTERNCMHTTSFGTGELIKEVIQRGAKVLYLFVGGSATCDAGIGMASALGYRFYDSRGYDLKPVGASLEKIAGYRYIPTVDLKGTKFYVMVDVDNPFTGINGAAQVYAPQKGASDQEVTQLDQGLANMRELIK
ncbi:MAG: glycerate kinase, partial [Fulvivirga sp.]|nr:glycerate kinase [Fulvivirga sp.]